MTIVFYVYVENYCHVSLQFSLETFKSIRLARNTHDLDTQESSHDRRLKSYWIKTIDFDVKTIHLLFPFKHLLLTPSSIYISLTLSIYFWFRLLMIVQKLRVIRGLLATRVGLVGRGGISSMSSFMMPAFMILTLTILISTILEFHVTNS